MATTTDVLPTFLVIGAAKAGTTSLAAYLARHPDIFVTEPKEPQHFTGRGDYTDIADYSALFADTGSASALGEASTHYSRQRTFPGVPERIHAAVPEVRLVYLTREPMNRLRSHYLMWLRNGTIDGSFQEFVTRNDWHVDTSCYGRQIDAYLEYFPIEQIHVARLEDLEHEPGAVLRGIAGHIGADPTFFNTFVDTEANLDRENAAPPGQARRYVRLSPRVRRLTTYIPPNVRRRIKSCSPRVDVGDGELELDESTENELRERFARDQIRLREIVGGP